jgi:NADPH-dependent 2,4-dienoyl-CoA reductase/sulfur reductase-like enzyme
VKVEEPEILVVGAGPAGLSAAIEARKYAVRVLVVDENINPGGQLPKQTHRFFGSERHYAGTRGIDIGTSLVTEARDTGVEILLNTPVVGIFDGLITMAVKRTGVLAVHPDRTILATGAAENAISFPGWTLPGVMLAGAAQTFINVHRVLVGNHFVIVGSGNVGLIIAYQIRQAGCEVVAIVEAKTNIGGWGVHAAKIRRMGIPILTQHTIKEVIGNTHVERVIIHQIDEHFCPVPGTETVLEADTVCLAVGMSPRSRLAEMAGCALVDIPEFGGALPIHNTVMQTTVNSLYCAGDIAGVEEASTAMEEGKLAGLGAAFSLGRVERTVYEKRVSGCTEALNQLRDGPFGEGRKLAKDRVVIMYDETTKC